MIVKFRRNFKWKPEAVLQLVLGLMLLLGQRAFAQNITVTGRVTGTNNEPLSGASVTVKGTSNGTTTNAAGIYTLSAASNATLVFSSVGYGAVEQAVAGRTAIDVNLATSAGSLEQIIVVGYGTQRKLDVTGSVATVSGVDIAKQASVNPVSALQGKVAGVQITNNGGPGSSPQIRIRGLGTVYGNANPLFVVDGTWFDDVSWLNPNDVENISILKDASSESIYGVRAANGVVLITTRKGKGKATVNYNGYVGIQRVTNMVKMVNASEYAQLINEKNGTTTFTNPSGYGEGTNWFDVILRNAFTTQHTISVGGGSERNTYSFSLGYLKQEGIIEKNTYDRITAKLQNDIQVTDFLKIGYTAVVQGSRSTDVPAVIYKAYTAAPVVPVKYADGSYGDPNDYPIGTVTNNPKAQLDFFDQKSKNYRVTGNAFSDVKLLRNLVFHSSFGGEFAQGEVRGYTPVYTANSIQFNNISKLSVSRAEVRNWIAENTLTYDKSFGDHKIKVLVGQSAQRYKSYSLSATADNVPNNSEGDRYLTLGSNTTANPRTVTDGGSLSTFNSYFSRINYSYNDRYLLNISLRADGSSKFIGNQRWGYFPSIGVGWIISDENFMKDQQTFNYLKLRGSWGKVGNASVPANLSVLTVNSGAALTAIYGGQAANGASITTLVPPTTYWERGVGFDAGLEASFVNKKLTAEIDYYDRKTEKAIFAIPVLGSLGTTSSTIIGNQADFGNKGIEFSLGWKDNLNSDWSYSINGNFSYNKNEVLSTETGANPIYGGSGAVSGAFVTRTVIGQPIGQFYGLDVIGIFQSAAEITGSTQPTARPGDFKYRDVNGDKVIDEKDRIVIGNPNPKYAFGLNTNFGYKSFDLTLDFQGVSGVDVYNANKGYRFGSENFTQDFYEHRWHGQGTSNEYPSADIVGAQNYRPNTWYVEDGSYIRLRNAQLGYSLPASLTSRWKIQRVRFYANAQNAVNLFGYTGFTPEISGSATNSGIDLNVYPLSATYNFGVNVTF